MSKFTRTWWGKKFIEAIESFSDAGRLSRGRAYATNGKVLNFAIKDGTVSAQVRGSVNPYYGVYKEPLYSTTIKFQAISPAKWAAAIALIASKSGLISRLMLNEIPETIEDTFSQIGLNLLPHNRKEFEFHCSCPDWGNPCKHLAGLYYLVAAELDRDPFLLFELRGLSRENLHAELAKSPLGQALSAELSLTNHPPHVVASYHTRPTTVAASRVETLHEFWHGAKRLPHTIEPLPETLVSAIPIKKQGDFPSFWERDNSFIEVMEKFYETVRAKSGL